MGESFGERHDETQGYVSSHKGELAAFNLAHLEQSVYFYAGAYFVFLILSYVASKAFVLRPVYFVIPLVLLGFWKIIDLLKHRPDNSLERVRVVTGAFYLVLLLVVDVIDIPLRGAVHISIIPMAMAAIAVLYADYFFVLVGMELAVFLENAFICRFLGGGFSVEEGLICAASVCVSSFFAWVLLGIYTDNGAEEKELKEESSTDLLTGLYNKVSFERKTKAYLDGRDEDDEGGILFIIDFDNFKSVNDEHGHLAGDAILKKFGQILKKNFRDNDIIGRVGGDEFMVMLVGGMPEESLVRRCETIEHPRCRCSFLRCFQTPARSTPFCSALASFRSRFSSSNRLRAQGG